jgi:acetyl esterase/lipase
MRRILLFNPWQVTVFVSLALLVSSCRAVVGSLAMPFIYEEVTLPNAQIVRDLPYHESDSSHPDKHRLDLFLPTANSAGPAADPWPVVVFVHGGGWTSGDRGLRFGGEDVYGNLGRYLAAHGIGAAVISYRLQFEVDWRDQVEDVARAVAWVRTHIGDHGGDPNAVFLMGHSAGAQLASYVALDRETGARFGVGTLCGLIPVSGAGFDLADDETYALGGSLSYYERRFRIGDEDWMREASVVERIGRDAPDTLILYAEDDWDSLRRQAFVLEEALRAAGGPARRVEVPGEDHYTVILALSRHEGVAGPSVVDFVSDTRCNTNKRG